MARCGSLSLNKAEEWPAEYLNRKEAYIDGGYKAVVVSTSGYKLCLAQDSAIIDVRWAGDAVVISYRNGTRERNLQEADRRLRGA